MLDKATLVKLWPRAPAALIDGMVATSTEVFSKYEINTPLRVAHFMAQISHESDGGTITEENMNYTTAARIAAVWPSRFAPKTSDNPQDYVRHPRELANKVYNGRMGNTVGTDDGYNFRGRGLLQITGKESYQRIGSLVGLNLIEQPNLVNDPSTALEIAACEFKSLKCLSACDDDDIRTVTRRVNGGYIGIDSRRAWLTKWKLAVPELPGELPPTEPEIQELNAPLPREADGDPASKTMAKSTEGWAAIMSIITALATAASQMVDAIKPLTSDPKTIAILAAVSIACGLFIWFRRRNRLAETHV